MTTATQQRDAETTMALIYLDWATRSAEKAAETRDPESRLFYRANAIRDFETAIAYLAHYEPPA